MKNLIYIFAFITSLCNAQVTDFIAVKSVTDTVNVGDTCYIHFTKTHNSASNGMSRMQLWTSTYLQDCMYISSMLLNTLPTDQNGYYIWKVKITQSMGTGNARIYSNATPGNYKPFYINPVSVGISEYDKNATITNVQYFDIYGKEKPSITEGLNIKLTTYSNGYISKNKIIAQQ